LIIRFIECFKLIATRNYIAITNSNTLLFTATYIKSYQFAFTTHFLVTDPNISDCCFNVFIGGDTVPFECSFQSRERVEVAVSEVGTVGGVVQALPSAGSVVQPVASRYTD
jgi:hypothetical protein